MKAHPRSRGENVDEMRRVGIRVSSSPLTRGKPPRYVGAWGPRQLIPAHAGKTSSVVSGLPSSLAHPRSRGENGMRGHHNAAHISSSPLTRGKPSHPTTEGLAAELIPAHAGKT